MDNGIQLEMNFDGPKGNRFKEKLDNGTFQVLVELNAPLKSEEEYGTRFQEIEFVVSSHEKLAASLSFNDRYLDTDSEDVVKFASSVCKTDRDRHVLTVSGRDRTLPELEEVIGHAMTEGFRNILCVSGSSRPFKSAKEVRRHLFTESVHAIRSIRENFSELLYPGCTVNPYKYTPGTLFPQYFKLMKKIHLGAQFIVTDFGWDMMKLQELRWSLYRRALHLPSIARFLILTPDRAEDICSGRVPGVHISPDLEVMLRREMTHSLAQFESAQWRRLQIHAAGAQFLGYSGIQFAGAERPDQINTLLKRVAEALQEFRTFEEWHNAYCEYYDRLEMAPYPYRFYEFSDLFTRAQPPEIPSMTQAEMPPFEGMEKFKHSLAASLFAHADTQPASEKRLTKKLLVSCRGCSKCRLPQTDFVCPETCPKGMANGPCGSAKVNGKCELSDEECIYEKRMRIAAAENEYTSLEETCVEPLVFR